MALATRAVGSAVPNTGKFIKPLARLIGAVPSQDTTIKLKDLRRQRLQLSSKSRKTRPGNLRHPLVTCIGDDCEHCSTPLRPTGGDKTELRHVSPDSIDHRGLLADKSILQGGQRVS